MKREKCRRFVKIGILCVCMLGAGSLSFVSVPAQAVNEVSGETEIQHIYKGKDIFTADPLVIKPEPELEVGEGKLTKENPQADFEFSVPRDGNYCGKVQVITGDSEVRCKIHDDFGNQVFNLWLGDGERTVVSLEEGVSYQLCVERSSYVDVTDFKFSFMQQGPTVDISDLSHIQDQILFEDQKNIYSFTPKVDGIYNFSLLDQTAEAGFNVKIWDSYGASIGEFRDRGIVYLEKGMNYQIQVRQRYGLGKYTLNINHQKEREDISGYTQVDDSIQYIGQELRYTFFPLASGIYHIGLTNLRSEFDVEFCVFEEGTDRYIVDNTSGNYNMQVEDGVELEEGKEYQFVVREDNHGLGDYSIFIQYPQEAQDALKNFSPESEEETDSEEMTDSEEKKKDEEETAKMKDEMSQLQNENREMEEQMQEMQEKYDALMEMLDQNEIVSE